MGIEGPKLIDTIALMQLAFSFATFAFFAAKHQIRVGSFSVDWGNDFYTIYMFYTAIICVGPRNGCFGLALKQARRCGKYVAKFVIWQFRDE